MFHVIVTRLVKFNTRTQEKFAPRTANVEKWCISGPFSARKTAERAAAMALGTHTALGAVVVSDEDCQSIVNSSSCDALYRYQDKREMIAYLRSIASTRPVESADPSLA